MADEKTEEATPKRREDERKKGNIARSQDMNSALTMIAGIGILFVLAPMIMEKLRNLLYYTLTHLNPDEIEVNDIIGLFAPYAKVTGEMLLPFMLALCAAIVIILRVLNGPIFTAEKIKPKIDKLTPSSIVQGLKKMFNPFEPKNMVEIGKSFLKMGIVGYVGFSTVMGRKDEILGLLGVDIPTAFAVLASILTQMIINICIAMLIIGFIDKKYQDYEYNKSIKMTKQEIKDEWKNMEGDPIIKSKIKSAQMQFMKQKMMSAVPNADVVVVNPTHFSVALKYDKDIAPAPVVVAKGVDYMAFKIREIAKANNVPIVENKPLARSLYKLVQVDQVIPAELYVAVAEILAFVYGKDGPPKMRINNPNLNPNHNPNVSGHR